MASETFRIAIDATVNDNTGPGVQSAQKRLSGFDKSIEHTKDQLDRLTNTGFHIDLDAVDRATATIQNVETKVHGFVSKAWNFTVGIIDKATAPLQGIINLVRNPVLQAGAIFGVSVSLADTVSTYGAFEESMSNVKAISGRHRRGVRETYRQSERGRRNHEIHCQGFGGRLRLYGYGWLENRRYAERH